MGSAETTYTSETIHGTPATGAGGVPREARLARLAVAGVFFINGAAFANWVTRIPAVQQHLGLGPGALGVALLGMPLGLLVGASAAGWLIAHYGSRRVTRAAVVLTSLAVALPAFAGSLLALMGVLAVVGLVGAMLDVSMNTHGVAVERRYGRPIMSSYHGMFSLGGFAGAAVGGALAARGVGTAPHLVGGAIVLGLAGAVVSHWLLPTRDESGEREAGESGPAFARPTRALLGLSAIAFCVLLAEGSMNDWSTVYLRRVLGTDAGAAAAGFAAFSLTMAAGRFAGDRVTLRLGPKRVIQVGGGLAALGLLAVLLAPVPLVATLGFACVGVGLSSLFPNVLSAAGRTPDASTGAAIAAVTTMGYLGFLVGPPLIGFVAEALTLRGGLAVVFFLSLLVIALARSGDH